MIKLEKEITRGRFYYRQVIRKGRFAIYEKAFSDFNRPIIGFEVIVIQKRKSTEAFGISYPPKELYPSSGSWGVNGFTFISYDDAIRKFNEIVSSADGRKQRKRSK